MKEHYTQLIKKEYAVYCWLDVNYLNVHFSPNRYHTGAIETNHHTWVATQHYKHDNRLAPPTARPERFDIDDPDWFLQDLGLIESFWSMHVA